MSEKRPTSRASDRPTLNERRLVVVFGVVFGLLIWLFLGAIAVFEGRSLFDRVLVLLPMSLVGGLASSWMQSRLRSRWKR